MELIVGWSHPPGGGGKKESKPKGFPFGGVIHKLWVGTEL